MAKLNRKRYCECGCGMAVKPGKRFVAYHHARGKNNPMHGRNRSKENNPMYGKQRPDLSERNRQRAGTPQSEESKLLKGFKSKEYWNKVFNGTLPFPKRNSRKGEDSHYYKHGLTVKERNWARQVKERDNYTCQKCFAKTNERTIHAHHIKTRQEHPELIYSTENGQTLCSSCHAKAHGFGQNQ